ncbi:ArsR/SmtB family transcription factor [Gemmatirosa kalamazoonensis]|uniref:ArsR/SmtB family transcription factor n=1 Tax=Gemmatirosa kalamazoonensis TaxID=861299 RepID=UPI00191C0A92|nr:metalloregulator ArsR/SmtB family transcription factor [Gemmatirosa kalamazoonensis]
MLAALRAAGERTRLRLLALLGRGELTVGELAAVLGQSQPRVSRHLKLLCDAGILDRYPEGTSVFYRLADRGDPAAIARAALEKLADDDPVLVADRARLDAVRRTRAAAADAYFRAAAADWDRTRSLYADEREVERVMLDVLGPGPLGEVLDVGTGTGRILELLAPSARRAVGVDLSTAMLGVARATVDAASRPNVQVRHADMYHLPFAPRAFDLVVFHQVLHYADDPASAVAEAARVLRPGGRVLVVDFAPHDLEFLRAEHAHRRLGFSDREVASWFRAVGLGCAEPRVVPGQPLDVVVWVAARTPGAVRPLDVSRGDAPDAENASLVSSAFSASPRESASPK